MGSSFLCDGGRGWDGGGHGVWGGGHWVWGNRVCGAGDVEIGVRRVHGGLCIMFIVHGYQVC